MICFYYDADICCIALTEFFDELHVQRSTALSLLSLPILFLVVPRANVIVCSEMHVFYSTTVLFLCSV